MFTIQQIHEAHAKVKSGADFPKYIQNNLVILNSFLNLRLSSAAETVEDKVDDLTGNTEEEAQKPTE